MYKHLFASACPDICGKQRKTKKKVTVTQYCISYCGIVLICTTLETDVWEAYGLLCYVASATICWVLKYADIYK